MRILLAGIVLLSLHMNGISQPDERVKVTDDVELIRISEYAYIHVSYRASEQYGRIGANGLLLINGNRALLFDTPWTEEQTENLLTWIEDEMDCELAGFVPNHWHVDCMGGLSIIHDHDVPSYASKLTIETAASEGLPVPEHGFSDSILLELGDISVECHFLGAAHSMDNIVVWIPSEKILFPACMVKSLGSRNLGNTADGDRDAYPETLSKLVRKFPAAEIVIPGHGRHGGLELVKHTMELAKN